MATKFDTKDWELAVVVGYQLKAHARNYVECPTCNGRGVFGGGMLGGDEEMCNVCCGRKTVHDDYEAEPRPTLPRGLADALRTVVKSHEPPNHIVGIDHHRV